MGLIVHSLEETSASESRGYYVYLLDFGWSEPLGEALRRNFDQMANLASRHNAVVVRGVGEHFSDEVLSWHQVNGQSGKELLPAILITTRNPHEFRDNQFRDGLDQSASNRMLIIPLRRTCSSTSDVAALIERLFADIKDSGELRNFKIARDLERGQSGAIVDARIVEPDLNGNGIKLDAMIQYLQSGSRDASAPTNGQIPVGKEDDFERFTAKSEKVMTTASRDQVFISYCHEDERWLNDLEKHLKPHVRNGSITTWSDRQIRAGTQWFDKIKAALAKTKVAILLVTPSFLASDFIHEHELAPLLKQAESGGVTILWVHVRACAYDVSPLKNYQAAFDPAQPLAQMRAKRDSAWVRICKEIANAVNPM